MLITADSKPVYCYFGGSDCWTCADLIQWHKLMVTKYGKIEANLRFLRSWDNDTPFICEQADCRSFDSNFRSYMGNVGLLPSLYSGIGILAKPFGFITDSASTASDTVLSTLKVIKYVIPVLIIGTAIGILVYVGKRVKLAWKKKLN